MTAVGLALVYIWTDFPISYASFGMLPYFLGIPLGLVATGAFARYLTHGGLLYWVTAAVVMSLAVLVHLTTAMVMAPAALLAYIAACWRTSPSSSGSFSGIGPTASGSEPRAERPWTRLRHVGVWLIPVVVLAVNAFWWLPGVWLTSTKGPSDFAFNHPEGVIGRLTKIIAGPEAPIQCILLATGVPGLAWMMRRHRIEGAALLAFCAAGFFWGYLAGGIRALDFLQPGRHTYALYSGLALAGASGLEELWRRLRACSQNADHFHRWVMVGAALIGLRMVGGPLLESVGPLASAGEKFLSSQPSKRLLWVISRVSRYVKPGERLLYEEGGKDLPGVPDPFQHGRFSGLLPHPLPPKEHRTGVEFLGGPYLHASLTTNFTQFGEGMLFGRAGWYRILLEELPKLDLAQVETVFGRQDRLLLEELRKLDPGLVRTIRTPHGRLDDVPG